MNECAGDRCSSTASTNGDPMHNNLGRSNRADESCEACSTGVPEPASKLAARADKLNMIRAVKGRFLTSILAWAANKQSTSQVFP